MGKVTKARNSPGKPAALAPEVLTKVNALRNEGSAQFLKKEFGKAAESYDQAVKLLPDGASEKAELLQKKVGCLINLKKYKEAARDATTVLEITPNSTAALKSRAKAHEQLGFLTKALSDVQAVNRTDAATAETRDMETRLRDAVKARPSSAPTAATGKEAAKDTVKAAPQPRQDFQVTIKATLGTETKFVYTSFTVSYPELLEQVRAKFPGSGPVVLKYVDKAGDPITITCRQDVQVAMAEMIQTFQKHMASMQGKMTMPPHLPPVKVMVVPVASEAEVPRAPAAEAAEHLGAKAQEAQLQQGVYEPEEWIMDFVRVFTDVTGMDPSAPIDHHQQGQDKLQRGIMEAVRSEAAEPLFDLAADHFRDAVVTSFIQWGNVYITKADRLLHKLQSSLAGSSPEWDSSPELAGALALFDQTEAKIREALKVHPESWEAVGSLAQLEFERAKAQIGYIIPPQQPEEAAATAKTPEEIQAAHNKQLMAVLANVSKEKVAKAKPLIDKCNSTFEEAYAMAKKAYEAKVARDAEREAKAAKGAKEGETAVTAEPKAEAAQPDTPPFGSAPSNMLVMHGNILYDWSQVLAATDAAPWRPVLDAAAVKFRASGAPEADVRGALKNHTRVEELDLGPDPAPEEPQAPATPVKDATADKKATPEAKGLPSLELKKKPAAAATTTAAAK